MQLLIATTNPAKIERYDKYFKLLRPELEIFSLNDLDPKHLIPEPIENGDDEAQNSALKARHYQEKLGFNGLVFAEDSGMILEGVETVDNPRKDIKKPVIAKYGELTPENWVKYYSDLASKYGGRIDQEWVFGYTLLFDDLLLTKILKSYSVLVSEIRPPIDIGYPLNSVTKIMKDGQEVYLSDHGVKEWAETWDKQVINLINELLTPFTK